MVISLNCPNCGAPLHLGPKREFAICIYCNSTIRILAGADLTQPQARVESALAVDDMAQLKQLLIAGRQTDAIRLYQQKTDANAQDAQAIISGLGQHITFDTMRNQILTAYGLFLVVISALLLVVSAIAGLTGKLHPLLSIGVVGFGGFNLLVFAPGIRTTLQFWRAPVASAIVVKSASIGVIKVRGQEIRTFKLLLNVQPQVGQSFQAELLIPVRESSLARVQPGAEIQVKYLLHDPTHLIFYKRE